jgi:Flp pilus assembly protein TadD
MAGMTRTSRSVFISFLLLGSAIISVPSLPAQQTHTTIRHHKERIDDTPPEIAQAEDAIQKGDFAGAETLLTKVLAPNPDKDPDQQTWSYQAWFDLGFALNRLGRSNESIAAYRKSVAAKPEVFESNLNLGLMLVRANSPEAEQFLSAATKLTPSDHVNEGQARAFLDLAHLLEDKKPEEAFADYHKAAELMPKDPEPHLSAALLHERRKEFSDAEIEYKQVFAIDSQSAEAVIGLTNIYMKSGQLSEAEPLLRKLVAARAGDAALHLQLGRVLAAENKNDDAVREFQTTLKLAPNDAAAQREIADLYATIGKNDLAENAYRPLLASEPNDPDLHRAFGKVLLREKKFPEAQQELIAAVRLKRDSPDTYVDLAFAANENKNWDLVIRALNGREMVNADPPPICFFLRASAYDHLHDWKQAALDYHHFLDVSKGKYPDQEWQATHRLVAIEPKKR